MRPDLINIEQRKNVETVKEKELFLQLLHNYPDGAISIIDRNFTFLYTGGELHERLNAKQHEIIGTSIYPRFPHGLRKIIKSRLEEVFNGQIITEYELPHPVKNHFYTMDAFPLREHDGAIHKVGVIIRNISRLKKAEHELRQTLEKEKQLNTVKSRFVATASHEFRTPLSTILASADLIDMYLEKDDIEKCHKHIKKIKSSVNNLKEILEDFLAIDKIEQGMMQPVKAKIDLKEFALKVADEFTQTLKHGQRIECMHTGNTEIFQDPRILHNIMSNLLTNASKYSQEDKKIELNTEVSGSKISITVTDYGIGVPVSDQSHLFSLFFRAKNAEAIQGTGLGLNIVKKYADQLNGSVSFESRENEGSTFKIEFPIA